MPDDGFNITEVLSPNKRMRLEIVPDKKSLALYEDDVLIANQAMPENSSHFCVSNRGDIYFLANERSDISIYCYVKNDNANKCVLIKRQEKIGATEDKSDQYDRFYLIEIGCRSHLIIVNQKLFELIAVYSKTTVYKKYSGDTCPTVAYQHSVQVDIENQEIVYHSLRAIYKIDIKKLISDGFEGQDDLSSSGSSASLSHIDIPSEIILEHDSVDKFCFNRHANLIAVLTATSPSVIALYNVYTKNRIKHIDGLNSARIDMHSILSFTFLNHSNKMVFLCAALKQSDVQDCIDKHGIWYSALHPQPANCLRLLVLDLEHNRITLRQDIDTAPNLPVTCFVDRDDRIYIKNSVITWDMSLHEKTMQLDKFYLKITDTLTVSGLELVAWAQEAVAGQLPATNRQRPEKIECPSDWLATAGYYSIYAVKDVDRRMIDYGGSFQSCQFRLYGSHPVSIEVSNKDAYVKFMGMAGDYVAIANRLQKLTAEPRPPMTKEESLQQLFTPGAELRAGCNQRHAMLAQALLGRMYGIPYPGELMAHSQFLDALLVLCAVVETSRNNTTFLTWLFLLDLIVGNHTFGRFGRAFDFGNAFTSGPGYIWNDAEHKNLGGKFPMAANSTNTGNMKARAEALSMAKASDESAIRQKMKAILSQPQHHYVLIREMKLMITWMKKYITHVNPNFFQDANMKSSAKTKIQTLFKQRISRTYRQQETEPNNMFLSSNMSGHMNTPLHLAHYQHERYVYTLTHKQEGRYGGDTKDEGYYHRTDIACKLLPEYVQNKQEKSIYGGNSRLSVKSINVQRKLMLSLLYTVDPSHVDEYFSRNGLDLQAECITIFRNQRKEMISQEQSVVINAVISQYKAWLMSYFDASSLLNDRMRSIFRNKNLEKYQTQEGLIVSMLGKLCWAPEANNPHVYAITKRHILECVKSVDIDIDKRLQSMLTDCIDGGDENADVLCEMLVSAVSEGNLAAIINQFEKGEPVEDSLVEDLLTGAATEHGRSVLTRYLQLKQGIALLQTEDFVDACLRAIRGTIDPIIEAGAYKMPVPLVHEPPLHESWEQLLDIMGQHQLTMSEPIAYIMKVVGHLQLPMPTYSAKFNTFDKKPCPSCYQAYAEPYSAMRFNRDNMLCFVDEKKQYHGIETACHEKLATEETVYLFVRQAKKEACSPCLACWVLMASDRATIISAPSSVQDDTDISQDDNGVSLDTQYSSLTATRSSAKRMTHASSSAPSNTKKSRSLNDDHNEADRSRFVPIHLLSSSSSSSDMLPRGTTLPFPPPNPSVYFGPIRSPISVTFDH